MPIIDYKARAEQNKARLFNADIGEKNKEYLKDFLTGYENRVSAARLSIFCSHITKFLEKNPDIKSLMYSAKDRNDAELKKVKQIQNKVNKLYGELKEELSINYYATIINVSLMFVKDINNDVLPDTFKKITRVSQKKQQRHLKSTDMWTWEDGLKAANKTNDIQTKAILLTQLDAGMRPSEFLDLNYGDITIHKDVIAIEDKATKNDKADPVILYRSVPYFLKWYNNHPTKQKDSPLWITNLKGTLKRMKYPALIKRIRVLAENSKIKKPFDFYTLRHSSCYLDKIENLPVELAAKRHRHSTKFFIDTYGRLDVMDTADRYRTHYGIAKENKEKPKNRTCELCGYVNEPDKELCYKCNRPLTLQKAMEMQQSPEEALKSIMGNPDLLMQLKAALELSPEQRKKELARRKNAA